MKNTPDEQYHQTLKQVDVQPVFILGLHRSGTSILYTMLTATGAFNPVTAYHLLKYDGLLVHHFQQNEQQAKQELTVFFKTLGLNDRGIDRLSLTADFTEEYGFLLEQRTILLKLNKKNLPLFTEMIKKIQIISENSKPLLLKNPFDFSNFLFIKKMYPQAKFIFIHRHPFSTLSSSMNAIQFLLKEKNPYVALLSPMYRKFYKNPLCLFILRWCFITFSAFGMILLTFSTRNALGYYQKNISHLSKGEYIAITYEELCENPDKIIKNIMKFLRVTTQHSVDFRSMVKPRAPPLEKTVVQLHKFIYKCLKSYFIALQYHQNLPEDTISSKKITKSSF